MSFSTAPTLVRAGVHISRIEQKYLTALAQLMDAMNLSSVELVATVGSHLAL